MIFIPFEKADLKMILVKFFNDLYGTAKCINNKLKRSIYNLNLCKYN